jgi:hypothetical protein
VLDLPSPGPISGAVRLPQRRPDHAITLGQKLLIARHTRTADLSAKVIVVAGLRCRTDQVDLVRRDRVGRRIVQIRNARPARSP